MVMAVDKYNIKSKNVIILFTVKIFIKLNELGQYLSELLGTYQYIMSNVMDLAVFFLIFIY